MGSVVRSIKNLNLNSKLKNLFRFAFGSKRRSRLGVGVEKFNEECSRYYRTPTAPLFLELPDELLGAKKLTREDKWEMLLRAKLYLSLRSVEDFDELLGLDWRRVWNKENPKRPIETMLDLFVSLKFAHEVMLPLTARLRKHGIDPKSVDWRNSPWYYQSLRNSAGEKSSLFFDSAQNAVKSPRIPTARDLFCEEYVDIVASEKDGNETIRMEDVCRSHSIWLDPIDAPKELYKWRLRIQKAIAWAYLNDCVPAMMTLTIYHRWNNLDGLLRVLQNSWDKFLVSGRPAQKRQVEMGLVGNIRRLEITINDGDENFDRDGNLKTNAGWHPHFHVLLFVPKDKFGALSDMETQMKKDWVEIVAAHFRAEFGEEIPELFLPAFEAHGLYLSRYNKGERKGELRPVKDSRYLDKIYGYDPINVYGGDKEISADSFKNSKIPFDLLREITAANIDLWCEYAIATKGMAALRISRPLAKKINEYFEANPDKDPIPKGLPPSKVVAHLEATIYRLFYRNFLIPQLKAKAVEGFESLRSWVKDKMVELGVSALCDDPTALPRPPNSIDDLLYKKILPTP